MLLIRFQSETDLERFFAEAVVAHKLKGTAWRSGVVAVVESYRQDDIRSILRESYVGADTLTLKNDVPMYGQIVRWGNTFAEDLQICIKCKKDCTSLPHALPVDEFDQTKVLCQRCRLSLLVEYMP